MKYVYRTILYACIYQFLKISKVILWIYLEAKELSQHQFTQAKNKQEKKLQD